MTFVFYVFLGSLAAFLLLLVWLVAQIFYWEWLDRRSSPKLFPRCTWCNALEAMHWRRGKTFCNARCAALWVGGA